MRGPACGSWKAQSSKCGTQGSADTYGCMGSQDAGRRFFFDFGDKRQQTVDGMLRSLAFQLHKCEADFVDLSNLFQAHQNGRDQPTIKALKDVVYKMLKSQKKKTSIVMDALDESETRDDLVQWMKDVIFTPELDHVQLIYTNRPEPEFVRDIPSLIGEENRLALDKQSINIDIRS
ncbi:unnamed protein product [Parascedosporium putredinis]|uniref:Nephrocystin 3-like N-terminal domain-containing protein n=1 Tax=Parascedosporium putredinis TaxID=1442378 RepID=A0A9P1H3F3_9PEZI|nr:unnamed protein product [Parascedosporium putredinis]CAI7996947.1 unnamed protein product [Parascedosporium putredinis]